MYSRKEAGVRHSTLNPPSLPLPSFLSQLLAMQGISWGDLWEIHRSARRPLFGISPSQGNSGEQTEAVWVGSPFPYLEESESGKTFIFGL